MSVSDNRLRANDAECAAKVLDGEAVIINLLNGTYYSLDKAGAVVWELSAAGHTIAEIVDGVAARYDVETARALADVERLIDELLAERLLVPAESATANTTSMSAATTDGRLPYDVPMLTT